MAEALDDRKKQLLTALVRDFVRTAQPVGSVALVEKHGFDLSPATIRNELAALEELGLIASPHTSAGRVPTEAGFRAFIGLLREGDRLGKARAAAKKLHLETGDAESAVKGVAKQVAELTRAATIVAFGPHHVYYTGLSHLFSQPEFQEFGRVARFSELIDRLDETVGGLLPRVTDEVAVWIGSENPFGEQCGTVIASCATRRGGTGAIAVLGPLRMDYERSYALVAMAQAALSEAFA